MTSEAKTLRLIRPRRIRRGSYITSKRYRVCRSVYDFHTVKKSKVFLMWSRFIKSIIDRNRVVVW